jgi:hypothetical protein
MLQAELNRWGPKYYSKEGKEPLLFLTVLLLSLQFRQALSFLLKSEMAKAYRLDGIHLAVAMHFSGVRPLLKPGFRVQTWAAEHCSKQSLVMVAVALLGFGQVLGTLAPRPLVVDQTTGYFHITGDWHMCQAEHPIIMCMWWEWHCQ